MPRRRDQSERQSLRKWPKAEGIGRGDDWLVTCLDELRRVRDALGNAPIESYKAVDEMIADVEARHAKVRAARPARPAWKPLHELCARADDHMIADAVLRLVLLLEEAKRRFGDAAKFRSALATDGRLIDSAIRFCHGLEDLFIGVPKPVRAVPWVDLIPEERQIGALRAVYAEHAKTLLATLSSAEVVDTLFMTTRQRELRGENYGTGPIKAATIAIVLVGRISEGSVDGVRRTLGLISQKRPRQKPQRDVGAGSRRG